MQQENSEQILYQKKAFTTWEQTFETIESWAKQQGFNVIYNYVEKKPDGTFRKRTVQCEYQGNYIIKSSKETTIKRISCPWHINLSEPVSKNPFNMFILQHIMISIHIILILISFNLEITNIYLLKL
jgi:hypothetical protein